MNKNILLLGFFGLLFMLVGCDTKPVLPYIQPVSPSQDLMSVDGNYELKFFVINPTVNTFIGNLTYEFDTGCLDLTGNIYNSRLRIHTESVQVTPNSQVGYTKEFTFDDVDRYGRVTDDSCLQTPLQIKVSLFDAGGDSRGSQNFAVTVTE